MEESTRWLVEREVCEREQKETEQAGQGGGDGRHSFLRFGRPSTETFFDEI